MTALARDDDAVTTKADNPFFAEFDAPFGLPPFERIKTEHFKPALLDGMQRQKAAIEKIVNAKEPVTFENTIAALDYSSLPLDRVRAVFSNLCGADTNEKLQAIEKEMTPLLTKHADDILLSGPLFARVKAVYERRDELKLTDEQRRLLEETYRDFARNGVALPPEKQDVLRKLNERISSLQVQFSNNLLAETKAFKLIVDDRAALAGLPDTLVAAAAEAAKKDGQAGKWLFTTDRSVYIPFLTFADNRALREKLFRGYIVRGDQANQYDNKAIAAELVKLRIQRAQLLGYPHHAAYVLEKRMAKTPEQVRELFDRTWPVALKKATREAAELQTVMDREDGKAKLQPWDWWYYTEKLKGQKYKLSESDLKPYFELMAVRDGAFETIGRLYGVTFKPRPDLPKYHEEVQVFEVMQGDRHLGILYMDFYPRPGKRPGAWKSGFRDQYRHDGKAIAPVIVNVFNFPRPTANTPALLGLEEVDTLFHELGHGIHGLFSDCTYPALSGTKVPRDFVELPSQILENWATHPEVLPRFAKHYKTGAPMPKELIDKIVATRTFNQGFVTVEYLSAALLDLGLHTLTDPKTTIDVKKFETELLDRSGMIPQIVVRYRIPYFLHIFRHGYEAGYYSYLWSEVIDADAFEAFEEKGIFDAKTAAAFRHEILERGNTADPMVLYKNFRGREPRIEPLLKRRGLVE